MIRYTKHMKIHKILAAMVLVAGLSGALEVSAQTAISAKLEVLNAEPCFDLVCVLQNPGRRMHRVVNVEVGKIPGVIVSLVLVASKVYRVCCRRHCPGCFIILLGAGDIKPKIIDLPRTSDNIRITASRIG